VTRWRKLGTELFLRYLDGNVRDAQGEVTHPPYPDHWYKRIIEDSGDHFLKRKLDSEPQEDPAH
jgi:dipeptidase